MSACPICGQRVAPREQNPGFPFCSERCRLIDLGRWLGEEYRVPVEEVDSDAEAAGDGEAEEGEGASKPSVKHDD